MAFIDDFSKKITEVGQVAVKKTKELAGTAKYEAQIIAEQKVLDSLNKRLAKECYESISPLIAEANDSTCINVTAEMVTLCKDISSSKQRIEVLKAEIEKVKSEC